MRAELLFASLLGLLFAAGCGGCDDPTGADAGPIDVGDLDGGADDDGGVDPEQVVVGLGDPTCEPFDLGALVIPDAGIAPGADGGLAEALEALQANFTDEEIAAANALCAGLYGGVLGLTGETLSLIVTAFARCDPDDEVPALAVDGGTPFEELCESGFGILLFANTVTGNRVTIDVGQLLECRAAGRQIRAALTTYGEFAARGEQLSELGQSDTCLSAFQPRQGEGDCCLEHWDCGAGLVCQADPRDVQSLRCLPPAASGEACGGARVCESGTTCTDFVCVPDPGENDVCGTDGGVDAECDEGLFCSDTTGLCELLRTAGASCDGSSECASGLSCRGSVCIAATKLGEDCAANPVCEGVCTVCRPLVPDGGVQECQAYGDLDDACLTTSDCLDELICVGRRCAPRRDIGRSCANNTECVAGAWCDVVGTGLCTALPTTGASCAASGSCDEGSCIDGVCSVGAVGDPCYGDFDCSDEAPRCVLVADAGTAGSCALPSESMGPCDDDGHCADDLSCIDGRCAELPEADSPCTSDGRCVGGTYCDTANNTCRSTQDVGGACAGDDECASGTCLETGTCAATGPGCHTVRELFAQFVVFSLLLPVGGVIRRRRRRRR